MKLKHAVVAGLALALTTTAFAQMKPEDSIKVRQAGYRFMAWNMGRIDNNLKGSFNKDDVIKAANAIQGIANSGMGALFPPGTDKGTGYHDTHVKPAFFDPAKADKLTEVATNFNKAANELAKVAATGDKEAIKVVYGKLGQSCKACHDDFRKDDH